jgi:HPt (histidine-containing phosphotransfer) domain-containing protein
VLEKFEKQTRDAIEELQECLKQSDGAKFARISHAIKGTAGIVAAEQLHLSAGQLEQFGLENQFDLAQKSLEAFRAEAERCSAYIATARSQLPLGVKT